MEEEITQINKILDEINTSNDIEVKETITKYNKLKISEMEKKINALNQNQKLFITIKEGINSEQSYSILFNKNLFIIMSKQEVLNIRNLIYVETDVGKTFKS